MSKIKILLGESKMLPNMTEQWENDNGKSVLVKCINGTIPKVNMTEDSTGAQNGTSSQGSLNGKMVHKHFFLFLGLLDFKTSLQYLDFYLQIMMQVERNLLMIYLLKMEKITVTVISSLIKVHLRVKTPTI